MSDCGLLQEILWILAQGALLVLAFAVAWFWVYCLYWPGKRDQINYQTPTIRDNVRDLTRRPLNRKED